MSTNLIDEMTGREAKSLLNDICHALTIGGTARTPSVILTNIQNASRRSNCLGRIESHLTYLVNEGDEECEECPLNWGADPDQYLIDFKAAIDCGDE